MEDETLHWNKAGWLGACVVSAGVLSGSAWGQGPANGISLNVDLRDAPKQIVHAEEIIPVQPGPMVLAFPKWIPGEHMPDGPIQNQAGFFIYARNADGSLGQRIKWERDPLEMFSYHITVPAGVTSLLIKDDFLATPGGGFTAGGSTSQNLAVVSWNTLLVYPYTGPSMKASDVTFTPSVRMPDGWRYGTALEASGTEAGNRIDFKPVSLEQLVDSPVLTGRFFREVELAPELAAAGGPHHYLDMVADSPEDVQVSQEHIDQFSNLVRQTGYLYRSRHYGSYHFLVTLSDEVAHFGLEHHQSSDDRVAPDTFTNDRDFVLDGLLLPHEFTHSWNGKYRRPAGLATPNYQVPMIGDGLWVYEGLTEYLGDVLAARCGIWSPEIYRDRLVSSAAYLNNRPGRTWRDLLDTARMAQFTYQMGGPYDNWRRHTDFYEEGELVWLDVDTTIRAKTNGKKSLNDFVAAFHGLGGNTPPRVVPYTFEDVVAGLNAVVPMDWAAYLNQRLDSNAPGAPLGGLTDGGWKLVYKDSPNSWDAMSGADGLWYSLNFQVRGNGVVSDVEVGGLADRAGFGPSMKILSVNGRAFSVDVLRQAIRDAKGSQAPLTFIVLNTGFYNVLQINYHEGEKFPALERIASTPDRLDEILKPMTK